MLAHRERNENRELRIEDRKCDPRFSVLSSWRLGVFFLSLVLIASITFATQAPSRTRSASATARARATGALKVTTGHPESVIFINSIRHGATNEKSELDLPHVFAGVFPVRVRTVGYADWNGSVLHYQRGESLRDKGKNKDAVEELGKAVSLRSASPDAHIAIARSLIVLQDFQEAEKQIQAAMKFGGRSQIEAQTVLANLRRSQGLVDESIVEYRKAIRLARGNAFEAHIGLAIALNELSQSHSDPRLIDEIAREYRIGITQDMETEPILYYQLGEILEKANRAKEAIEAYRNYLRHDPEGEYASAVESIIKRLKEENKETHH